jgi:hypothetical protein
MKKRSAMAMAAVLVAALLAAGTVVSFSLSGTTAAAQGSTEPVVLTKHRTVTVHREAKPGAPEVVTLPASGAVMASFSEEEEHDFGDETEDQSEHAEDDHSSGQAEDDGGHGAGGDD